MARRTHRSDAGAARGIEELENPVKAHTRSPARLSSDVAADIRHALRAFARTPGLTAIIVLTLALGIGATTAIFSVVNAVLLRPLPYAEPDRLVQIVENVPAEESFSGAALRTGAMNQDEFDWWRQRTQTLSHMAVTMSSSRTLATEEGTVRLGGAQVSPALFAMRGVPPLLGRGLLPAEERPDAGVVVLAEATWRRYFGADPGVLGTAIVLDGRAHTIVGVMPPAFGSEALWTPYVLAPPQPGAVTVIGVTARLADGVSLAAASAEANVLGAQLRGLAPEPGAPPRFEIVRQLDQTTARVAPALRVLVLAAAVVLLIVCTNVANLLLVRGTRRQQEIAVRRSLGATRGRIAQQVLTESVALAMLGGIAGAALAYGGVELLKAAATSGLPDRFARALGPTILPRLDEISIDPVALGFVAALSLATGALFGLLPALKLSRFGEAGHSPSSQPSAVRETRVGHGLATAQLALAMTLLVGAGLLLNSFFKLASVDAGFDPRSVLSFELVIPGNYTPEQKLAVSEELVARLDANPLVSSVGFTDSPPLQRAVLLASGWVPEGMTEAEMRAEEAGGSMEQQTQSRRASSGYLRALGARLVAGRWADEPGPSAAMSVIVSRPYADRYFAARSPIGATIQTRLGPLTIVGVVDDIHLRGLDAEPERIVFADPGEELAAQRAQQRGPTPLADQIFLTMFSGSVAFAARTAGEPLAIAPEIRALVRQIDPALAVDNLLPLEQVLSGVTTRPRFYALLLGTFGAIAAFIAVIGIYGVLAYLVGQRTKEIGIRMALGAERGTVLALVLRQGAAMVAVGVTLGLAGAVALTRSLEGMLFGLTTLDPATYVVVAAAFAAVALFASYLPARRATAIDPLGALRHE
jgi:putative ABC transport system permease protein